SDAINALTQSDADTMRRLADGLKRPDRDVRLRAIFAISCIRIAPDEVCYPALEGALKDPDSQVRTKAARAIAQLDQNLKGYAGWPPAADPEKRAIGARKLGGYRTRARAFLTNLEAAAQDDDPKVREAATAAIGQVRGPESLPTD